MGRATQVSGKQQSAHRQEVWRLHAEVQPLLKVLLFLSISFKGWRPLAWDELSKGNLRALVIPQISPIPHVSGKDSCTATIYQHRRWRDSGLHPLTRTKLEAVLLLQETCSSRVCSEQLCGDPADSREVGAHLRARPASAPASEPFPRQAPTPPVTTLNRNSISPAQQAACALT